MVYSHVSISLKKKKKKKPTTLCIQLKYPYNCRLCIYFVCMTLAYIRWKNMYKTFLRTQNIYIENVLRLLIRNTTKSFEYPGNVYYYFAQALTINTSFSFKIQKSTKKIWKMENLTFKEKKSLACKKDGILSKKTTVQSKTKFYSQKIGKPSLNPYYEFSCIFYYHEVRSEKEMLLFCICILSLVLSTISLH